MDSSTARSFNSVLPNEGIININQNESTVSKFKEEFKCTDIFSLSYLIAVPVC